MDGLTRGCGVALACGGALLVLLNVILTPLMPLEETDAVIRSSTAYLVRLSVAGVDALLLVFGTLGVHLAQRAAVGRFGVVAFVGAFVGCILLVAIEWANVFVLRPVAQVNPEALDRLGDSALMMGGFTASVSLFGVGWLLLAISAWMARVIDRRASVTVIAGLVLTTALTPLGVGGAIAGSVVLGVGMLWMGWSVARGDGA